MDRRLALVALWLVFAVAAVGVGFGAANLVGGPFADGGVDDVASSTGEVAAPGVSAPVSSPADTKTAEPEQRSASPSASRSPSASATPSRSRSGSGRATATPSRPAGASPRPTRSGGDGPATTERSLTTRGGVVSAACRAGLVSVGASPAVGWRLDKLSEGRDEDGEASFRTTGEGDGEVEVHVRCVSGTPRFEVEDKREDSSGHG